MITITIMIATNSSMFVFMFAHTKVARLDHRLRRSILQKRVPTTPTRVVAKPPYFSSLSFATRAFRPWHLSPRPHPHPHSQLVLRRKTSQWTTTIAHRPRANRSRRSSCSCSRKRKTQLHSSHNAYTSNPRLACTSLSKHTRLSSPRTPPGSPSIQYIHSK